MRQKREQHRITIHRVGQVSRGQDVAWCEITNLTEKGLYLNSDLAIAAGQDIEVEFDLTPICPIHCTVRVAHAIPSRFGGRITAISPEHQKHLSRFIAEHIAMNLIGF